MVTILFLAANPQDMNRLKLKAECDAIDLVIRTSPHRDQFTLIPLWEARAGELQDRLRRHNPDIVHFSGHGSTANAIYVENEQGFAHPIADEALAKLFRIAGKRVRCVVLNACYTEQQAKVIAQSVEYVVGMVGEVADDASIAFARGFYQALVAGDDLQNAVQSGSLEVTLKDSTLSHSPVLHTHELASTPFSFVTKLPMGSAISPTLHANGLQPRHNLRSRDYSQLIGRHQELASIHHWLHPSNHENIIAIEGIGGIGKSALALEVAYHYLEKYRALPSTERFEAIISISAKPIEYTTRGPHPTLHPITTLDRIYATLAIVLEDESITRADHEQRDELVKHALIRARTLLIIDNLDIIGDQRVIAFLNELPPSSKAIVTTQLSKHPWAARLRLRALQRDEVNTYLDQWPQARLCLTDSHLDQLYKHIGGIPLALRLCFAGIEYPDDFDRWFAELLNATNDDIVSFCVGAAWQRLEETAKNASEILKLLSLFDPVHGATADMLIAILGRSEPKHVILNQLAIIVGHSLANRTGDNRYTVLPLVQQYLTRYIGPDEHQTWRRRQVHYYLDHFLQPYIVHIDFVCGTSSVLSDATEIDNIELLLTWAQSNIPATDYLRFVDGFSSLLYLVGFVKRAIEVAAAGLSMAQSVQDQEKQYDFYNKLILYYTWSDRFAQAEVALQATLTIGRHVPTYRPDNVLDYFGAYLMRRNMADDLLAAYAPLRQSKDLREHFAANGQDRRVAVLGRFLIGVWCYRMARRLVAQTSFTHNEALLLEQLQLSPTQPPPVIADLLLGLSERSLQAALTLAEEVKFDRGRSYILNYLGNISTARHAWSGAEASLTLALRLAEALVDRRRIARVQESLFHLYLAQGKQIEAKQWAQLALERFTLLGMTLEQQEIQDALNNLTQ